MTALHNDATTPTRRIDPDCTRIARHPDHRCTNRDGGPIGLGQACWATARTQVRRGGGS